MLNSLYRLMFDLSKVLLILLALNACGSKQDVVEVKKKAASNLKKTAQGPAGSTVDGSNELSKTGYSFCQTPFGCYKLPAKSECAGVDGTSQPSCLQESGGVECQLPNLSIFYTVTEVASTPDLADFCANSKGITINIP